MGVGAHASFCLLGFEKADIEGDVDLGKAPLGFFVCTARLSPEKPGSSSLRELIFHNPRVLDSSNCACYRSLAAVSVATDMLMHMVQDHVLFCLCAAVRALGM